MKLTYYGNAMMLLKGKSTSVLCDPWVSFDRISKSGLFTFPELKLSREDVRKIKPDFLYITHTHEDHFDPDTLALFPKDQPILVSYYPSNNFTERNVKALGFTDVRVADPEKGLPLNGSDHCWIEPNGVYDDVDSLGVFKIDQFQVLNANDNPYDDDQCVNLRKRFGELDLACVPFSFQGPYPAFYENLSEEERAVEAKKKALRNYEQMVSYIKTLNPRAFFPFAAGAVYGGRKALMFPHYGVGTAEDSIKFLMERHQGSEPVRISQCGTYDLAAKKALTPFEPITYEDQIEYLRDIASRPGPFDKGGLFYIQPSEWIDLTDMLVRARERQKVWQQRRSVVSDAVFFIDCGQEWLYRLCLADTSVTKVKEKDISDAAYEIFRMPYSLLIGMLTRHYNYSNVKTQHMTFNRQPNIFNRDLHILMSFLQV
jgi:L-ascorbate metabolism protein UlaG (beta-lactamase superfamily)